MRQIIIIKLGNDDRPASDQDLAAFAEDFQEMIKGNHNVVIAHHAISVEYLELRDDPSIYIKGHKDGTDEGI